MIDQLRTSLVRFFTADDAVVGVGFLVSDKSLLTCAHVVAAALDLPEDTPEKPGDDVHLDFPLVAPEQKLTAHVVFWFPIQANGGGDITVLELDSEPSERVRSVSPVTADDIWGDDFRAFGFPGLRDGVWASGKLRDQQATGWIQIEDVKDTGYRVERGFSGGPVWDNKLDGVVGMVVAEGTDARKKAAYIIPTAVLVRAWPQLGQQTIPPCPYRGLVAFREQDAQFFFGREAFTSQLLDALHRKPLVAVIGSSGSGKSSVVFAGLLPRLRQEGTWRVSSFRPGNNPFRSLAAALMPLLEPQKSEVDQLREIHKLAQGLQQQEFALGDIVAIIHQKSPAAQLLLIADQFEELYTLCAEREIRQRFLDTLLTALPIPSQPGLVSFKLVLTLRADFVGQAIAYRPFADALQHADLKLGPMTTQELQDAIKKPAQQLKVEVEDGLIGRILKEITLEPTHLPLLEFALTLLWAKQRVRQLTHAAYDEIGGVEQALATHAESVYDDLSEEEQRQAQGFFLQLVRPGLGTEDTRRFATRAEVGETSWDLVVRLSYARLVAIGRDTANGEETVEVIHEALIRGWQRLREWMQDSREFRTWQERLRVALHQWESNKRDEGALLRGALLVEATQWMAGRSEAISTAEQAFIMASQQHQGQEERHLRNLVEEAERQAAQANRQRQIALARGLAAQAELLRNQSPLFLERSLLLAIESMQRYPSLEAEQTLRQSLPSMRRCVFTLHHQGHVNEVAFSPDGSCLVTTSGEYYRGNGISAELWESSSGRRLALLFHQEADPGKSIVSYGRHLAFSPVGRYLAVASSSGTAGVWEVPGGRQLLDFSRGSGATSVVFSDDGRYLATIQGGTIGVWDIPSGRQVAHFPLEFYANDVAFSPDGRYLATAGSSGVAEVWEVASGGRIAHLSHEKEVITVIFSPDGHYLATGSGEDYSGDVTDSSFRGMASVWEIPTGRQLARLAHESSVTRVVFSPDGRFLAIASNDNVAGLWEVPGGPQLARLSHEAMVNDIAFCPDGQYLATACNDGTTGLWEVPRGRQLARLFHENGVKSVTFSPDGLYLATASSDATARVWETSRTDTYIHLAHENRVHLLTFSPDGRFLATASWDHTVRVWDASLGQQRVLISHQEYVESIDFSPDGCYLATAAGDGTSTVWDISTGQRQALLSHRKKYVLAALFSPDGRFLATVNSDWSSQSGGTLDIWETTTWNWLFRVPSEPIKPAMAFHPDGHFLATAHNDGTARIWEIPTGRQVGSFSHKGEVFRVTFSPDGHYLATGTNDSTVVVWEVSHGREVVQITHEGGGGVYILSFSPDGRYLASASEATIDPGDTSLAAISKYNMAGVWEVPSGRQVIGLREGFSFNMAFSSNGHHMVSASGNRTAPVWEIPSGRQIAGLTHEEIVQAVAFSPDDRYLATASGTSARIWRWRPEDLLVEAQGMLTRNLTPNEWKQYLGDEPYRKTCPKLP